MTPLEPRLFAEGPARDARFQVKSTWAEMANLAPDDPRHRREFLHRQMHEELNGLEIAARNLADFPDAAWELRLAIARQCWDEARHIELFRQHCERLGGWVGEFPVLSFQYRIITRIDSLAGRLAVQNRSFEAAGVDAIQHGIAQARAAAEPDIEALLDTQLADEIQHVRYANVWVKRLIEAGGAPTTFQVAQAVAQANEAIGIVAGAATVTYPVAETIRREAGFDDAEIEAVRRFPIRRQDADRSDVSGQSPPAWAARSSASD